MFALAFRPPVARLTSRALVLVPLHPQLTVRWASTAAAAKTQLRSQIQKEKAKLKQMEAKAKEHERKVKERSKQRKAKEKEAAKQREERAQAAARKKRAIAKEKKITAEATKTCRSITPWTYFIKKYNKNEVLWQQLAQQYHQLSQDERARLIEETDRYNAAKKARYPPRPKLPPSGYLKFIKDNYPHDALNAAEAVTELAKEWKTLSEQEKQQYKVLTPEILEKHARAVQNWTDQRIKAYLEDAKR